MNAAADTSSSMPPAGEKPSSREKWRAISAVVLGQNNFDLLCRLTLLLLIVHPSGAVGISWYQTPFTLSLCSLAIVYWPLTRRPGFWFVIAGFRLISVNFYDWAFANNHDCLVTYWCLALGCSLCLKDRDRALAINGRLLIGLVFLFATGWKLTTPEFRDGTVYQYLLYHDERFFEMSRVFGDLTVKLGPRNHMVIDEMQALQTSIRLRPDRVYPKLSVLLAWWTILIEAAVAVFFLLPRRHKLAFWGDIALLGFITTTYPWVNVFTFSWVLITMGLAQCPPEFKKIRMYYLLMVIYSVIFAQGDLKAFLFRLLA